MREFIDNEQTPLGHLLAHESEYWATIAQVEQQDGWKAFSAPHLSPRIDPNHAGEFRSAVGQGERITEEVVAFYRRLGVTPAAYVDCFAPPDLIPCLLQAGFQEWSGASADLMIYIGPDTAQTTTIEVETVRDEQARTAWASIVEEEVTPASRALLHRLYATEISHPRITAYLVRIDGQPVCRGELFASGGLGRVEAIRTALPYRNRGLAAAVVRQAIRDSQAMGNALIYLYAEPGGDAQRLYHRLGFRTVTQNLVRSFILE
jgi:GNAT superfamily N-acetyltransferase